MVKKSQCISLLTLFGFMLMTCAQLRPAMGQIVLPGPGIITTVAGNGSSGYSGNGGSALSAYLDNPYGVAVDSAGNIYIADSGNNVIRKVTASTGIITTVAGNGYGAGGYCCSSGGYSGDGGPATSAELSNPLSVAVDSAGNLYIADTTNSVIRKVTASTGIITTVAGGGSGCDQQTDSDGDGCPATSAWINADDVAVDSAGNIYSADTAYNVIRMVSASTGIITTVAGTVDDAQDCYYDGGYSGDGGPATGAELSCPWGVAVDSAGNIYIADTYNMRIREVTASTGIITTVAGGGSGCSQQTDSDGDGCPATSAEVYYTYGVAVDSAGNIYIQDSGMGIVRKITASTGIITTVAGNDTYGCSGDGGPATSATLDWPYGMATDSVGNLYIADNYCNSIRAVGAIAATSPTLALSLTTSGTPSTTGQPVTFTATISPSGPTGTVSFLVDGIVIGSGTINGTTATYTTNTLAVDTYTVSAYYLGDSNYAQVQSNAITQVVSSLPMPALGVSCSPSSVTSGSSSTCTATVPSGATGTASFSYNGITWATSTLSSGSASANSPSTLPVGTYTIVASYSGDSNNSAASASTTLTVQRSNIIYSYHATNDSYMNGNVLHNTDSGWGAWSFGYDQLYRLTTAKNTAELTGSNWAENFCWVYDNLYFKSTEGNTCTLQEAASQIE
jgi:hypothetical protein